MAVIINDFEVVVEPPPVAAPPSTAGSADETPAPMNDDIARSLRRIRRRAARLAAD
jgi:hypothetical protein